MTPAFLLLVTVFAIWPDTVSPCNTPPPTVVVPPGKDDCYCGLAKRGPTSKIVGGKETGVNEYPWQVLLRIRKSLGSFICGGSLISNLWVLTAAHCVDKWTKASDVKLVLGEHDWRYENEADSIPMDVTEIIIHEDYDHNSKVLYYDFALLKMKSEIDFGSHPHIRPICLPADGSTKDYIGYTATATGWGDTRWNGSVSPSLQEVDVTVVTDSECKLTFRQIWNFDQILCANGGDGKGICSGDSGGPLVTKEWGHSGTVPGQNYELIGVNSFTANGTCVDHPQGYARVTAQLKWIKEKTKGSKTCPRT